MNLRIDTQKTKTIVMPCEVFSRISGYMRPVYINGKRGTWNSAKFEEYTERRMLNYEKRISTM